MDPNSAAAQGGPPRRSKTSPWIYVGCGCAVFLVLAALGGFFFFRGVFHRVSIQTTEMRDPRMREQRAREVLAFQTLPDGYYPGISVSVPFVMDLTMLTDRSPSAQPSPEFGDRLFMFMRNRLARVSDDEQVRRQTLHDRKSSPWSGQLHVDPTSELGDGDLTVGRAHVTYRAVRGEINSQHRRHHGISSLMVVACPDHMMRFAIWAEPDPSPETSAANLDTTGTPADKRALAAFLGHFDLCVPAS